MERDELRTWCYQQAGIWAKSQGSSIPVEEIIKEARKIEKYVEMESE